MSPSWTGELDGTPVRIRAVSEDDCVVEEMFCGEWTPSDDGVASRAYMAAFLELRRLVRRHVSGMAAVAEGVYDEDERQVLDALRAARGWTPLPGIDALTARVPSRRIRDVLGRLEASGLVESEGRSATVVYRLKA